MKANIVDIAVTYLYGVGCAIDAWVCLMELGLGLKKQSKKRFGRVGSGLTYYWHKAGNDDKARFYFDATKETLKKW